MNTSNWNFVSKTATEVQPGWSNRQVALFHYFNPNGLYAAKKATNEAINAAVDAGTMKAGAIIAYGTLNTYFEDRLRELVQKKRVNATRLAVVLDCLRNDIALAKQKLESAEVAA